LPAPDRPALITYFRQGRLDKFFRAHAGADRAEELDFFTTAETLETTAKEPRQDIPPAHFYPLLDKNKEGFQKATTPSLETLAPPTAAGSGNEAILLKRLQAKFTVLETRIDSSFENMVREVGVAMHDYLSDTALSPKDSSNAFWTRVQAQFGKGSGYRENVLSMYADQLDGHEEVLVEAAEESWRRVVIDPVLEYLAEE